MTSVMAIFTLEGDPRELREGYDRVIPGIRAAADELGAPESHVCASGPHGLTIVDVWESGEALERFAAHPEFIRLRREAGLPDPVRVDVTEVHAVGWPATA